MIRPLAVQSACSPRCVRTEPRHDHWLVAGARLLSQIDVATRQTYVMVLVESAERTLAAAYTNNARYRTRPLGPPIAALVQQTSGCRSCWPAVSSRRTI